MPNPMKGWKHSRQPTRSEAASGKRILPLLKAPEWDPKKGRWVAILTKKLREPRDRIPDVVGKEFGWDGKVFVATKQVTISDTEKLRELNYNRRQETGYRAYFYVYFEEGDLLLALRSGLR